MNRYNEPLYFYHLIPKGSDVSKGLLSPYALLKAGEQELAARAVDKYRVRLCSGWGIYPNKKPNDLTLDEIMAGLEKFRGVGGTKQIYFFRFPPTRELGRNMRQLLQGKDIYRINLNDMELNRYIEAIDWGYVGSHTDNPRYNRTFYETIKPKEYFSKYNDNPTDGTPLFAPLAHIGITFKNGICPRKFLTLVSKAGKEIIAYEVYTSGEMRGVTVQDLNVSFVNRHKDDYYGLRHVRTGKDYTGKVLLRGKEVIGFVNVCKGSKVIQALEINDKYRRQGYGSLLLGMGKELGANTLYVYNKNFPALALYRKHGWKETGKQGKMIEMMKESLTNHFVTEGDIIMEEKEGTEDPSKSPEGGVEGGGLDTKKITREVTKRQHMREGKRSGSMPTHITYNFKNDVSESATGPSSYKLADFRRTRLTKRDASVYDELDKVKFGPEYTGYAWWDEHSVGKFGNLKLLSSENIIACLNVNNSTGKIQAIWIDNKYKGLKSEIINFALTHGVKTKTMECAVKKYTDFF